MAGTQSEPFLGFPSKNRKMDIQVVDIHEFKDGRIIRTWHTEDWMSGLRQLGVFERQPEREAVYLFAKHEGLLLDPVYTGRAAAGMIDLIRNKFFKKDETVLFLHTGGQPALFVDKYANKI